jgi:hypothetical protein
MWINGYKKSIQMSLDISPLFLHIVSEIVQALVVIYDEIFQALAVEGDFLLRQALLDSTPPTVQHRFGPTGLSRDGKLKKRLRDRRFPSDDTVKAEVQKYFGARRLFLQPRFGRSQ